MKISELSIIKNKITNIYQIGSPFGCVIEEGYYKEQNNIPYAAACDYLLPDILLRTYVRRYNRV